MYIYDLTGFLKNKHRSMYKQFTYLLISPVQSVTAKRLGNVLMNLTNSQPILCKHKGSKDFFSLLVDLCREFHQIITPRRHRIISVWISTPSRINQLES